MRLALVFACGLAATLSRPLTLRAESPDVPRLIRQLDAESFADRRQAREALLASGPASVTALQQSAGGANTPLASECISLLSRLAHHDDASLARLAEQALMDLARSDSAAVAALAKTAVEPASPVLDWPTRSRVPMQAAINLPAPGRFGLPPGPNGRREAEFDDNGRRVKVTEAPNGEITIRLTETVDGQPRTTELQAANLADLLRKNRDALRLYAEFRRRQILGGMGAGFPAAPQGIAVARQVRVMNVNGALTIEVTEGERQVRFDTSPGQPIHATVTEGAGEQQTTRTIDAADLTELRTKAPDLAQTYEQSQQGLRFRASPPFAR